ncbi:tyrosine-type recombinase/integrase [Stappia sp. F7233]|uniref:Tyrosine-type recombinase/integrase n=1 Tax=Stappia albiluteola TaxID=2758565 RepID=A0A839AD05_9HYPH|nr:tyrosine-type recombinase/integrase [Stappia albiluteola]MBA5777026.1 tyrosine-type recombinase/integrase [Stappia albiluteola]
MRKHHPKNERIKRQYLAYLEEAKRMSVKSTDQVAAAIAVFEASTGYKDFAQFHIEQARKFKRQLNDQINPDTGKPLAKATIHSRLMALKAFFHWLAGQPGYKSRISYSDADYFNPSANDSRIATARRERPVPSAEQIRHVIFSMKAVSDIEKRNRALITFAYLTGMRDDAMASLSIRHVDMDRRTVDQDARSVRTKNRKTIHSWFFPVGKDIEQIVIEWIDFLKTEKLFGPDDPLFPATEIGLNADGLFAAKGLSREHWKNADPIRKIFRQAFEAADLPYFNPHSFRNTLAQIGERMCKTPEYFKAWSQNLGHERVLTTLISYGAVASHRQAEIMANLATSASGNRRYCFEDNIDALAEFLLENIKAHHGK